MGIVWEGGPSIGFFSPPPKTTTGCFLGGGFCFHPDLRGNDPI